MIQPITSIGNPILHAICKPIEDIGDNQIQQLATDLIDTLASQSGGVGIAAPQIGVDARMFLLWLKPNPKFPDTPDLGPQIIINPKIIEHSEKVDYMREGCLSIPGPDFESQLYGDVPRWSRIQAEYYNQVGDFISTKFEGLMARIFQHEYDHIDGILFLERMDNLKSLISGAEIERRRKAKGL